MKKICLALSLVAASFGFASAAQAQNLNLVITPNGASVQYIDFGHGHRGWDPRWDNRRYDPRWDNRRWDPRWDNRYDPRWDNRHRRPPVVIIPAPPVFIPAPPVYIPPPPPPRIQYYYDQYGREYFIDRWGDICYTGRYVR